MIVLRGRLATVGEVFFDEPLTAKATVDLIRCVQRSSPLRGAHCVPFHTRVVELRAQAAELAAGLDRVTRYEIRRAETTDHLEDRSFYPADDASVEEFCDFFDRVTRPLVRRRISRQRVRAHANGRVLDLSCVGREEERLAWHAYHRTPERVRLLYSSSMHARERDPAARALASRANRLLHWRDMLRFQAAGIAAYDLGGWHIGARNGKMADINRFKASFGGSVVREFNCAVPITLRGRATLLLERLLERVPMGTWGVVGR